MVGLWLFRREGRGVVRARRLSRATMKNIREAAARPARRFDTFTSEEHPRFMKQGLARVSALVAVLAMATGAWAECAGWQSTPEARMACCVAGDACPMHKSGASRSDSSANVSQADADRCCAASTQDDSTPSTPNVVATAPLAAVPNPILFVAPPTRASLDFWRALSPRPGSQVPRHLLLSVFLI